MNRIDKVMMLLSEEYNAILENDKYYQHILLQLKHYHDEKSRIEKELQEKMKKCHGVENIHLYGNDRMDLEGEPCLV